MRLLASTDFALRILMTLGQARPEDTTNVETLAQRLGGLSRNHLHKIVQELASLGFVGTIWGAGGGVRLAKPAREVKIGALVRALELEQAIVECFRADHGCCTLEARMPAAPDAQKSAREFLSNARRLHPRGLPGPRRGEMIPCPAACVRSSRRAVAGKT